MKSGIPTLLVPLPDRIRAEFLNHAKRHADELSAAQLDMLQRYAANEGILNHFQYEFYDYWEANDRRGRLEEWTQGIIAELLVVYK